jgi:DNA-binding NtrC family response regulator
LRERKDDLPFLVDYLLKKISTSNQKPLKKLSLQAFAKLESYNFPGNVRELENILERAFVLSKNSLLEADEIAIKEISQKTDVQTAKEVISQPIEPLKNTDSVELFLDNIIQHSKEGQIHNDVIAQIEKILLGSILTKTYFNKSKAARLLGLNRLTLDKKIKDLGLMEN